jgi:hypothetical protein
MLDEALRLIKGEPVNADPNNLRFLQRHRDNPLAAPLLGLLNYVGGWDLTDPQHPIVIARKAYEEAMIRP